MKNIKRLAQLEAVVVFPSVVHLFLKIVSQKLLRDFASILRCSSMWQGTYGFQLVFLV